MQGRLILKGGQTLVSKDISKKKKKKNRSKSKKGDTEKSDGPDDLSNPNGPQDEVTKLPAGTKPPSEYEAEFKLEMARAEEGKARSTAWGVTYKAPPKVLHGYNAPALQKDDV